MNSYLFYLRPCSGQLPSYHRYISAKSLPIAWGILGTQIANGEVPIKEIKCFPTMADLYRAHPDHGPIAVSPSV